MAVALAAASGLALSAAVPASASSTPVSTTFSQNLAGYSTIFTGNTAFNDVRADLTVPSEPANPALMDSVAVGVVMQEFANGASDPTIGFGLVWNDQAHTGGKVCDDGGMPSDQWTLEYSPGGIFEPAGQPVPPAALTPVTGIGGVANHVFCVPSGTSRFYVEIHDSTLHNTIGFDAGALEPGDVLATVPCPFGPNVRFHEVGAGVDTTNGTAASDLNVGTLAGFWRDGVTVLLQPGLKAGKTNSRLTLDHFDMREYLGTADGTSSGTPSLTPSGLGIGSSFTVRADT